MKALHRTELIGLCLMGLCLPARSVGIEAIYVVSGESTGSSCSDIIVEAKQDALYRAAEICDSFILLETRYYPNNEDNSCAKTASGENMITVTMRISCPVTN